MSYKKRVERKWKHIKNVQYSISINVLGYFPPVHRKRSRKIQIIHAKRHLNCLWLYGHKCE